MDKKPLLKFGFIILILSAFICLISGAAFCLPVVDEVVSGEAQIQQIDNSTLEINAADNTIINYDSFDIGENESVIINLPSINNEILNRVLGDRASQILGKLSCNGIMILINQNGIFFGPKAEVNAASFIASTRDISDTNFLNSDYIFEKISQDQLDMLLLNQGKITIRDGGFGVLIAGGIENQGTIIAPMGTIALAAGDLVRLDIADNGAISVAIDRETASTIFDQDGNPITDQIKNTGTLQADGGVVLLKAESITDIFEKAINLEGHIQAAGLENKNGVIRILSTRDIVLNAQLFATEIQIGKAGEAVPENVLVKGGVIEAEKSVTILANNNLEVKADITAHNGDVILFADYDGNGQGEFTQSQGKIEAEASGNVLIDGSGTMTLGEIVTAEGAIKIGTQRAPSEIAGNPQFVHTSGDFQITEKTIEDTTATLKTSRQDVLKYNVNEEVTLEAKAGFIKDLTAGALQAQYLRLIANGFDINSSALTTELFKNTGDMVIQDAKQMDNRITLEGEDLKVTYLAANNVTLKSDGRIHTSPGVIIQANEVKVVAREFGTINTPLNIQANNTYIKRIFGDIDIMESLGIGTSILLRGPPENGFGAIIYSNSTSLTLDAQRVIFSTSNPTYLYGNITFHNFTCIIPGKEIYFEAGKTYTFKGNTYIKGTPGYDGLIKLLSNQNQKPWYSDFSLATNIDISYVAIRDAHNIGEPIKVKPSTNWGNCLNWDTDPVWDGQGLTLNWSEATNWDTDTVPTEYDLVTFNSTSHKDSVIDSGFAGVIAYLTIDGYLGTITQERTLTITQNYLQTSGTFRGTSFDFTVNGNFSHTGGFFYAPAADLTVKGAFDVLMESFFTNDSGNIYLENLDAWFSFIQKLLALKEYQPTLQTRDAEGNIFANPHWHFANRANNMRAYIDAEGFYLEARVKNENDDNWIWTYAFFGFGRENGDFTIYSSNGVSMQDNTITIDHGDILEWYKNSQAGIEQGFTINTKPQGEGFVILKGLLSTNLSVRSASDQQITFSTDTKDIFTYSGLKVRDSSGKYLPATMSFKQENGLSYLVISIDDAGALYPLFIDPISTTANWTAEGNQASAFFGNSVATAGDVNGDGYSDAIIGSYLYDNGFTDEGKVFVYHGSSSGLSTSANWTASGGQASAYFGSSVACAGDVNADGYSDVIIGARFYTGSFSHEGAAFVYHGSGSGLSTSANWTATGGQASAQFGYAVATAGDVNGDGYSDVIIGAPYYTNGQANEGAAFVYQGSGSGLSTSANWTQESNQATAYFGASLSTAGDVNGDGYSDVIVGAYLYNDTLADEGKVFVYHGAASGLSTSANWTAVGGQASAYLGASVSTAGDVNGDGYADVIIGAPYYDNGQTDEGRAYVYYGSTSGLSASPDWTKEINQAGAHFGNSVAFAGDVNGDAYADVIIGAPDYTNGQTNEGGAFSYFGSASGLSASADWSAESDQASSQFGSSVACAGDVNGDGYSDVIVGAYLYDNGSTDEGRTYVYNGSASGLSSTSNWTKEINQASAQFGASLASAGDVNADGYADVIIGAPYYDNGQTDEGAAFVYHGSASGLSASADWSAESDQASSQFGSSVACAGDVNGDGYSDVIIGAYLFDGTYTDEGKVFVYHGSTSGLVTSVSWSALGNQATAYFGHAVATAGDINGDGYSDVIIGSYLYDGAFTDEGKVFVYHGSSSGLPNNANWTTSGTHASEYFGNSVATAGDVNGDGYSDVIIGARFYTGSYSHEGAAFVYHGSGSGLPSTANWSATGGQAEAQFGFSVATAGDVNNDGYSDVIVGAYLFNATLTDEGKVFVYHGASGGLSTSANWTAVGGQANAYFGSSVATAGDVNGDGYSDVIIGAYLYDDTLTDEGKVFVYHGSSSGLSATADWTAVGGQANAYFGSSVACAGDVNGDGYSDVIIGAPYYDNGQTDEGRAYVYYGNNAGGLAVIPRQLKANSDPMQVLGLAGKSFFIKLFARTPMGRTKVKLWWEVKGLGTSNDMTGLNKSSSWTDIGTAGINITESIGGFKGAIFHWRVRIQYFPNMNFSPWFSIGNNSRNEGDFRVVSTAEPPPDPPPPLDLFKPPMFERKDADIESPRGKYRTIVIVFEGKVAVTPYDEKGLKNEQAVILTSGQSTTQERTIGGQEAGTKKETSTLRKYRTTIIVSFGEPLRVTYYDVRDSKEKTAEVSAGEKLIIENKL